MHSPDVEPSSKGSFIHDFLFSVVVLSNCGNNRICHENCGILDMLQECPRSQIYNNVQRKHHLLVYSNISKPQLLIYHVF